MKNPFHKSTKESSAHIDKESDITSQSSILDLEKRTAAIEAEREQKRFAREEKNFHKAVNEKRKRMERWVAPVLLILTILCSFLIYWQSK